MYITLTVSSHPCLIQFGTSSTLLKNVYFDIPRTLNTGIYINGM